MELRGRSGTARAREREGERGFCKGNARAATEAEKRDDGMGGKREGGGDRLTSSELEGAGTAALTCTADLQPIIIAAPLCLRFEV